VIRRALTLLQRRWAMDTVRVFPPAVHNLLPGVVVQPHLCDDPQCDRPPVTRITPAQWAGFRDDGAAPCPCGGTLRRVHQEAQ
jgi:hypothetical protein